MLGLAVFSFALLLLCTSPLRAENVLERKQRKYYGLGVEVQEPTPWLVDRRLLVEVVVLVPLFAVADIFSPEDNAQNQFQEEADNQVQEEAPNQVQEVNEEGQV